MLTQARIKLKNVESSIAFIQEQHAKTLEGLHQEIQKLQQKNASKYKCWPSDQSHEPEGYGSTVVESYGT